MVDSGVNVELLPELSAGRWRDLGLRFATKADLNDMGFLEMFVKSLDLIRVVRPLQGTIAGMCRSLHVLLASGKDFDVSYSDPSLPFSIFVSCPLETERDRVERLAENVVHEALHLQLSLVESLEPLVTEVAEEELVFSPWKAESRTLRGLVDAVYVFGNLRHFWKRVALCVPGSSSFGRGRVEKIDNEMIEVAHLAESRFLTEAGRRMAMSLLAA